MRLAKQNGGPWQNREHCFRAADGDARGEALFWGSNGPAMKPGEGQMGNVGSGQTDNRCPAANGTKRVALREFRSESNACGLPPP